MKNFYKAGTWNAVCDVCGFNFKSDELRKRWDGLMVCSKDFETRHPQDLIRIKPERVGVPWGRQETVVYLTNNLVTESANPLVTEAGDNLVW